jgi:hypothetical protein
MRNMRDGERDEAEGASFPRYCEFARNADVLKKVNNSWGKEDFGENQNR